MTRHPVEAPQFYLTAPSPCPYLTGRMERKVFAHLVGSEAVDLNNALSQGGFRRSQNIAYRPACEGCRACISVRILASEFRPTKSMKRIMNRNSDLVRVELPPSPTPEQYSLFRSYLDVRHPEGGMADMSALDFSMMIEDTHVNTSVYEYRRHKNRLALTDRRKGPLVAAVLVDRLQDGLSLVYSFFEPDEAKTSIGTYIILDQIRLAQSLGLPYVYLGYWVDGSDKMAYKARFRPQERLLPHGWIRVE